MEEEKVAQDDKSQSENQPEEEVRFNETDNSQKEAEDDNKKQSSDNNEEVNPAQWVNNEEEQPDNDATLLEIQNSQSDTNGLLLSNPLGKDQVTPPSEVTEVPATQSRPPEPCWYCLRSLDSQYRPQVQEESDPSSTAPSTGQQRMLYQTDPRPHFGVAWSSHAPDHPLWDSEGPCWGQRNQEMPNPTHTCPHCHLGLPADTLRWHEAKCLLFEQLRSANKNQ